LSKYAALLEDEEDILGGSPKSKFWEMLITPHEDTSKAVLDEIVTNYACMEHIIKQTIDEEVINEHLKNYYEDNKDEIEYFKKSLYMEFVGKIVWKMPQ
jgi:phage host-nuclease inhibitor protein Gam